MSAQPTTAPAVRTAPNFRTNADQLVNFGFGTHGDYLVKYLGKCPVSGIRMYDLPGASYIEHQATSLVAAEYDMTGPDLVYSWLASNDQAQYKQALALAMGNWLPGPAKVGPTASVVIRATRWFDRSAGNTYFSAVGIVNGTVVARIAFQYGYDTQYLHAMTDKLEKLGFLPGRESYGKGVKEALWNYATRTGITQTYSATDVSRRRDL